ncbi:ornithine racemase Orr [Enterococcus pingfangensis]|uniref:ornithine racemase Orr n=1 Tax=Enterococcus pingfangensis TaxID=2559924 RepID=UPI0010F6A6A9|nr:ornithine racemase Orr [Enterococcus pingfangensis]
MRNPRIVVDRKKLRENISFIVSKLKKHQLSTMAVTKVFNAHPEVIALYDEFPEILYFGDSRIENLMSYHNSRKQKVLIRLPMISEATEVVQYADISFNSEIATIRALNQEAVKQKKNHKIVLMVDLGDLREGFFEREALYDCIQETMKLENIQIYGLGVNLTCYGAIIPSSKNLGDLISIKTEIEERFNLPIAMISGGNSSSLYLLDSSEDMLPIGINNLRIGESFVLGRETAYGADYKQMNQDAFTLVTEIVELKEKPSYPIGEIGVDAFGRKPQYVDKGNMKRCIVAIGLQDVSLDDITPKDSQIEILGASSDHLLLDLTHAERDYKVGDEIEFTMSYGSVLSTFTSKYIKKEFIR